MATQPSQSDMDRGILSRDSNYGISIQREAYFYPETVTLIKERALAPSDTLSKIEAVKSEYSAVPDSNALALDRTVLANERTYQAWLRTGLAAFGAGLGIAKFLKGLMPTWIVMSITALLIIFSAASFLQASWRYCHLHLHTAHLEADAMPTWKVKVFSMILVGCSVLAFIGLLVTAIN